MTSGYSPIGAMIASDRLFEPFKKGTTYFPHGYTFGGHPVSAAVAMANLDIFEREGLNEHVKDNAPKFRATLEKLLDLPIVGDVRGAGYFYGIELVKDKDTRETFNDDGVRAAAARLPVQGPVRRRPLLPRRRPGRPGHPARAAADHRPDRVRRHRVAGCARSSRTPRSTSEAEVATAPALTPALVGSVRRTAADARLCPVRATCPAPTSSSSALATPASGPPTTCCATSPRSTSWCSRPSTSASGPAGATAAGSRRSGRWGPGPWPASTGATRPWPCCAALRDTVDEVGPASGPRASTAGSTRAAPSSLARTRGAGHPGAGRGQPTGRRGPTAPCWLDAAAARERLDAAEVHGATFNPHCARVHPRRLVDGLAAAVRGQGGRIAEGARVDAIEPGRSARTAGGHRVSAPARHPGHRGLDARPARPAPRGRAGLLAHGRHRAHPDGHAGTRIGLAGREVFADHRHVVIYGQRTATTGSPSAGGARPTTGGRASGPSSTTSAASSTTCGPP